MQRCHPEAPGGSAGDVAMRGIEAGRRWTPAAALVVGAAAALAALGVVRLGWHGLLGVGLAGVIALLLVIAVLRPTVACCAVRRASMGTVVQVTAAAAIGLALGG